jgi:hypothetical protein
MSVLTRRIGVVATALLLAIGIATGLAACGGNSSKSSGANAQTAIGAAPAQSGQDLVANGAAKPAGGPAAIPTTGPTPNPTTGPATPLQQRAIVRTGSVSIESTDVDAAANQIVSKTTGMRGRVDGDTRVNTDAKRSATLVLRVPPGSLDNLIASVVGQGKELNRSIKGEDVTSAQADVNARVLALTTSVARLRDFLTHSGSITDLVALESDLTQREAQLESTVAQQSALKDEVSLATLTVSIAGPSPVPAPVKAKTHNPSGFGAALSGGWHGLTVAFRWTAAVLGYLLPFAILVALLCGLAFVGFRRLHSQRVPQPTPDAS